jgi:ribose/xylose/arabinose/galactoside ABC-type transport system permease subunit/ABC-type branched-subunit amino acid transport system ATPase component
MRQGVTSSPRLVSPQRLQRLIDAAQSGGLLCALLLLCTYLTFSSSAFLTTSNIEIILVQVSVVGLVAVPGAMLLLGGYVDLSVGSIAVLSAVVFGELAEAKVGLGLAVAAGLATGLAWGALNGILIAYLKFSPIVVTLGGYAAARGIAEVITQGLSPSGFGDRFAALGNDSIAGLPVPVVILALGVGAGSFLWYQMPIGRHIKAIGADPFAAHTVGVPARRIICGTYVASGLAAALGGLVLASQLDSSTLGIGLGMELSVLTAILLGGVSFNGGRGSLFGVVIGVLFIGTLTNGLVLLNITAFIGQVVVGAVMVGAAGLDRLYQLLDRMPIRPEEGAWNPGAPSSDGDTGLGFEVATLGTTTRLQAGDPSVPRLEVRSASKRFGAVTALDDVSFQVGAGEVVGLVGDNGAGKSTLVSLLAGAQRPDDGQILVDGEEQSFSSAADARQAGIETVFQTLALVPTLDIVDNVFLNRELLGPTRVLEAVRRLDKGRMRREAVDGLARLGLSVPDVRAKTGSLSGGQRQAVAIARAVLWGGRIVILDEPAAALGVRQTQMVLEFVEQLKRRGVSVIFISHNVEQILRVTDRVVVLRLGRKAADAATADVTEHELLGLMAGLAPVAHGDASIH